MARGPAPAGDGGVRGWLRPPWRRWPAPVWSALPPVLIVVTAIFGYIGLRREVQRGAVMREGSEVQQKLEQLQFDLLDLQAKLELADGARATVDDTALARFITAGQTLLVAAEEQPLSAEGRATYDSLEAAMASWTAAARDLVRYRGPPGTARLTRAHRIAVASALGAVHWLRLVQWNNAIAISSYHAAAGRRIRVRLAIVAGLTLLVGLIAALEGFARHRHMSALKRLNARVSDAATEWTGTFDAIRLPIIIANQDFTVRRLNRAAAALTHLPPARAVGQRLRRLDPRQLWTALEQAVERTAPGRQLSVELTDEAAGRRYQFHGQREQLHADDECVILVGYDLTDVIALEQALRERELMSAIGAVAAGVAHEVRNPLHAVEAIVGGMEARFAATTELRPFIEHLRRQVQSLTRLMQELLEFGRPAAAPEISSHLDAVVEASARRCDRAARTAGVELLVECPPQLPAVRLDADRLASALDNLVVNALQHTPAGGRVTVAVTGVGSDGTRALRCVVRDTGPGIAAGDLERVFEPFFTRRRGGTGLGLAIARKIVREHGGQLTAANAPGGGAVFAFELPVLGSAS